MIPPAARANIYMTVGDRDRVIKHPGVGKATVAHEWSLPRSRLGIDARARHRVWAGNYL